MITNDEECIEFYNLNLKGKGLKLISIKKKSEDFINYIQNRFSDTDGDEKVKELIYRIEYNIEIKPKCPVCGSELKFDKNKICYSTFCSKKCMCSDKGKEIIQLKTIATNLEKYGCKVSSQSEIVKEKMKQTCLMKYGTDCTLKDKGIKEKAIQTWLLNYGVSNPNKSKEIKEKTKQTCIKKYGVDNPFKSLEIRNKSKKTCLVRYGTEYALQNDRIKEKQIQTCLKKYGTEYVMLTDLFKLKSKESCIEKYGTEYVMLTDLFKLKSKESCIEKYGVEHPMKLDIFRDKAKETCLKKYGVENPTQSIIFKEKSKQTCLKHFGCEFPAQNKEIMHKVFKSRCLNKDFKFSKKENEIYDYLITIDKNTIRLYYSELYPFHCDFYLPKFNVYIEYQGMWTHGSHPFNINNEDDIKILNKWKDKSEVSKFYKSAIQNWTITDPLKRETAKINNLNYLEIFYNEQYKDKIISYLNNLI